MGRTDGESKSCPRNAGAVTSVPVRREALQRLCLDGSCDFRHCLYALCNRVMLQPVREAKGAGMGMTATKYQCWRATKGATASQWRCSREQTSPPGRSTSIGTVCEKRALRACEVVARRGHIGPRLKFSRERADMIT